MATAAIVPPRPRGANRCRAPVARSRRWLVPRVARPCPGGPKRVRDLALVAAVSAGRGRVLVVLAVTVRDRVALLAVAATSRRNAPSGGSPPKKCAG